MLVGTTDTFYAGDLDRLPVTTDAVDYLLAGVNRYFPTARLTNDDVLRTFVGARPLLGGEEEASEDAVSRDDRVLNPAPGIWAITGGKLTTYRAMAEATGRWPRARELCRPSAPRLLDDRASASAREILPGDASPVLRDLWSRYGAAARSIERLANEPELSERIDPGVRFVWAEVEHALDHEWVERLDDLLDRRLGAFLLAPECDLRPIIARWLEARGHHVQSAPEPVPHF